MTKHAICVLGSLGLAVGRELGSASALSQARPAHRYRRPPRFDEGDVDSDEQGEVGSLYLVSWVSCLLLVDSRKRSCGNYPFRPIGDVVCYFVLR